MAVEGAPKTAVIKKYKKKKEREEGEARGKGGGRKKEKREERKRSERRSMRVRTFSREFPSAKFVVSGQSRESIHVSGNPKHDNISSMKSYERE